jgi:hypothetical protein
MPPTTRGEHRTICHLQVALPHRSPAEIHNTTPPVRSRLSGCAELRGESAPLGAGVPKLTRSLLLTSPTSAHSVPRPSKRNLIGNAMRSPFIYPSNSGYAAFMDLERPSLTPPSFAASSAARSHLEMTIYHRITTHHALAEALTSALFIAKTTSSNICDSYIMPNSKAGP